VKYTNISNIKTKFDVCFTKNHRFFFAKCFTKNCRDFCRVLFNQVSLHYHRSSFLEYPCSVGHVHITDFNIATVLSDGQLATSVSGTTPYMGKLKHTCDHMLCQCNEWIVGNLKQWICYKYNVIAF
jgi:hypothetical protein